MKPTTPADYSFTFRREKGKEKASHQNETLKSISCMCFNSKESICMPVFQRCDMEPKDCLIHLLTIYFSHPHTRLNLHPIARCEMGNLHPHLRALVSPQEDQEACQVQNALLHVSAFHALPSLPPTRTLSISGEELLVCLAFFLLQLWDE